MTGDDGGRGDPGSRAELADGLATSWPAVPRPRSPARRGHRDAAAPGERLAGWAASRSTCCAASRRWRSRRAPSSSPAARSTPGTPTSRWPGPARTRPRGAEILAAPPELARALVCAAVRETFEESGVLLAGRRPTRWWPTPPATTGKRDRHALLDRSLSLAELLAAPRLVLRGRPAAAVVAVDHPGDRAAPVRHPVLRRRAARRPAHQGRRRRGGRGGLDRPAEAIAAGQRGEMQLLPPTAVTLAELAACGDLAGRADRAARGHADHPGGAAPRGRGLADRARPVGYPAVTAEPGHQPAGPIDGSGTDRARCVLAPNPSLMTLDGTNTWLIAEPGCGDGDRRRPGPRRRGSPAAGLATAGRARASGSRSSCSPTGTATTRPARRGWPS